MKVKLPKIDTKKMIKPFLPKYEVISVLYHAVPGLPVQKNKSHHPFEKGESKKAKDFFEKVVAFNSDKKLASEVHLKRGRFTVKKTEAGPMHVIKDLKKKKK